MASLEERDPELVADALHWLGADAPPEPDSGWEEEAAALAYHDAVLNGVNDPDLAEQIREAPADRLDALYERGEFLAQKAAAERRWLEQQLEQAQGGSTLVAPAPTPDKRYTVHSASEILEAVPEEIDWLVPDVLARGWSHKIGGREKAAGKGTLCICLIGCMERGEPSVFGPSAQLTALICTEEPEESLREKLDSFAVRRAGIIFGRELRGMRWEEKVQVLVAEASAGGHELLYVENLSRAAGIVDESGTELGRAVELLADACAEAGLTLLTDVHHKKGGAAIEDKTRGGTALPGAVDVNIEIVRKKRDSRVRHLYALGRVRAANWSKAIELSADGKSYRNASILSELLDSTDGGTGAEPDQYLTALKQAGMCTPSALAERMGVKADTARRHLNRLGEEGLATKLPGTHTAGGRTENAYVAGCIGGSGEEAESPADS